MQLTVTKKSTATAARAPATNVTKKIQARIVHDDENDVDEASAVADETAAGQGQADKVGGPCHDAWWSPEVWSGPQQHICQCLTRLGCLLHRWLIARQKARGRRRHCTTLQKQRQLASRRKMQMTATQK